MRDPAMPPKHSTHGFTLIELMIVVAIIGILATIAIPLYQDYVARSQIHSALYEISGLKTAVEDTLARGQVTSADSPDMADLGVPGAAPSDQTVDTSFGQISKDNNAAGNGTEFVLTMTLGEGASARVGPGVNGVMLSLRRQPNGQWLCEIADTPAGWKESFTPSGCSEI
ncbi:MULTISPECIES: pilin [unclassified Thioalkalivibrio]|uniref:pilin n=1 Tax=unclassified Thioalkalivibrio TaxID=2621013 RepID=UPI0003719C5E|nr:MULTISPECIES: pilin [unclassified Thioalkalivibrio]